MAEFKISLPLYLTIGVRKKRKVSLNINQVFNMHYQARGLLKKLFTTEVSDRLGECPTFKGKIQITYTIYRPTRQRYDVMNVVTIIDKFLQDTLVLNLKITDDNYSIVPKVIGIHGGIDKNNPRVEVLIQELECGS